MNTRYAVIILLLCASAAAHADLGRMFFTPAQRATLDDARKKNTQVEIGVVATDKPVAAPEPRTISVDGMVKRSDGNNTVWLNNRPVTGKQSDGVTVSPSKTDDRVRLSVPGAGRGVDLKVGQAVEIVSGTIADSFTLRARTQDKDRTRTADDRAAPKKETDSPPAPPKPADTAVKGETPGNKSDARAADQRNNLIPK
jgi:hypothetical protein